MTTSSLRLLAAIAAFGRARHELVSALQDESPDRAVVRKGRVFIVVPGKGGSPALIAAKVVNLKRPGPAHA